jgi:predicted DNA-binding transcriptional regulator YafY
VGRARHSIAPAATDGEPRVRFEKLETLLRVALDMRGNAEGLSLADIERDYGVSRRTAERMRDAIERVFPQMEQANPGELPKRWRIRAGALSNLIGISAEELAALNTAVGLMRREAMAEPQARLEALSSKLKAMIHPDAARRIGPDLEILAEAEGIALRPGPRQTIAPNIIAALRHAIMACKKVQLYYRARGSGALSRTLVCPYGFLYGNRHYLVADSLNPEARGFRLYSLPNIEKVEQTKRAFTRRKNFSLQNFAERSFGVFQEEPVDVVWCFSPKAAPDARQFLFHPTQSFEEKPDGSLIVRFRAGGLLEMAWHLVTWAGEVRVVKPKRLASLMLKLIQQPRNNDMSPVRIRP